MLIHIGLPKTGSTFLQTQLFKTDEYHNAFKQVDLVHQGAYKGITPERHRDNNSIVSWERFSTDWFQENAPVPQAFNTAFPKAKILVVTREYHSWLKSLWGTSFYNGHFRSFDDFTHGPEVTGYRMAFQMHLPSIRIKTKVDTYATLFGNNFLEMKYEHLKEDPQGFCDTICDFADIPKTKVSKKKALAQPRDFDRILRIYNKHGQEAAWKAALKEKARTNKRTLWKINKSYRAYRYVRAMLFGGEIEPR